MILFTNLVYPKVFFSLFLIDLILIGYPVAVFAISVYV